jgi:import receptor subunit TOM70
MASPNSAPILPPSRPIPIDVSALPDTASSSLWDRITSWASENKALVYTIAGVTLVVTAAGVVYYSSEAKPTGASSSSPTSKAKANKKAKRKAKKEAEEKAKVEETEEKAKTGALKIGGDEVLEGCSTE